MSKLYKFFITKFLSWVAGLTTADFENALALAKTAENQFTTSETKRGYVMGALKKAFPVVSGWILNMLLESAVAYLKRSSK